MRLFLNKFGFIFLLFLFAVLSLHISVAHAADSTLVAHWLFDESSGDAADSSSNGVTLTNNGSVGYAAGEINNAASFNASNYFSNTGGVDLAGSSFTISAWIKANTLGANRDFFSLGDVEDANKMMHLRVQSSGAIRFGFFDNDLDTDPGVISTGTWYHVVFVYDAEAQTKSIYVDGDLIESDTEVPAFTGSTVMQVGKSNFAGWDGLVDDLRIYSRALADEDLAVLDDTSTEEPFLALSAGDGDFFTTTTLSFYANFPEPMLHGSFTMTFTPESGEPVVVNMRDAEDSVDVPFDIKLNDVESTEEVISSSSNRIKAGLYAITISYQDEAGNAPASGTISTIPIEHPPTIVGGSIYDVGGSTTEVVPAPDVAPTSVVLPEPAATENKYQFVRTLRLKMTGDDVKELQNFLNAHGSPLASSGNGSVGNETNYYGTMTAKALTLYQEANTKDILTPLKLTKGTGIFGSSTIKFVNALLAQ